MNILPSEKKSLFAIKCEKFRFQFKFGLETQFAYKKFWTANASLFTNLTVNMH